MHLSPETYQALVTLIWTIATALLWLLANAIRNYLRGKLKTEQQREILDKAWAFTLSSVQAANQTTKPLAIAASSDGQLSREEATKLRDAVIEQVCKSLGKEGLELLNQATGERTVREVLETFVESAVLVVKNSTSLPSLPTTHQTPKIHVP